MYQFYFIPLAIAIFIMSGFSIWLLITLNKQPDSNEKARGLLFTKVAMHLIFIIVLVNVVYLVAK